MRKLFYEDINITDFTATVVSCEPTKDGKQYRVLLDATAFFPEEGGQSADKGTLNGLEVLDVQIQNDLIYHYIDKELPTGSSVTGHVNWEQRFDFMQQHSGEHIISGLVHHRFGYNNVGFHLSVNEVTLDFNGELTLEQLKEIELRRVESTQPVPLFDRFRRRVGKLRDVLLRVVKRRAERGDGQRGAAKPRQYRIRRRKRVKRLRRAGDFRNQRPERRAVIGQRFNEPPRPKRRRRDRRELG